MLTSKCTKQYQVWENVTHKIVYEFQKKQTDDQFLARKPDSELINKKRMCQLVDFAE